MAQAPDGGLRVQIETLAAAEGIATSGLEELGEASAMTQPQGTVAEQLESLLRGHDYTLWYDATGRIAQLRISGLRTPNNAISHRTALPRPGGWQAVTVELSGPSEKPMSLPFIVDANTTITMLSTVYIKSLGYAAGDLEDGWIKTTKGRIPAKLGRLNLLRLGPVAAHGVAVAFVDDEGFNGPHIRTHVLGARTARRLGLDLPEQPGLTFEQVNFPYIFIAFGVLEGFLCFALLWRFGLIKGDQFRRAFAIGFVYGGLYGLIFGVLVAAIQSVAYQLSPGGITALVVLAFLPMLLPTAAPQLAPLLQRRNLWPF